MVEDGDLPQWARERLEVEQEMGTAQTNAPPLLILGVIVWSAFRLAIFVLLCVVAYMIGKAVVG